MYAKEPSKKNSIEQEILLNDKFSLPKLIARLLQLTQWHWTYEQIIHAPLASLLFITQFIGIEEENSPIDIPFESYLELALLEGPIDEKES